MRTIFCVLSLFFCITIFGQDVTIQVQNGITNLEKDPQFKHAILSMYVVYSKTGKVVFDKNSEVGLAPASCQKVITSASAFELLGKGYRYKTEIYAGKQDPNSIHFDGITLVGFGDPTLGSWRFFANKPYDFLNSIKVGLTQIKGDIISSIYIDNSKWGTQIIPNGWVWEDIGNYYGAGASSFNWKENQYDIVLQSGKNIGDKVKILSGENRLLTKYVNELLTAGSNTGDNAYIYFDLDKRIRYLRGTIPLSTKPITITGAVQNGSDLVREYLFSQKEIIGKNELNINSISSYFDELNHHIIEPQIDLKLLNTHYSPTLDSINYWFLKKSINLYGEAFVKTIGYQKKGVGATDTGLSIIKYFWKQRGIDPSAINIIDGSGLSPANRITTNALVTVMQFAKKQNWFSSFYNALPDMNGIKMKDGYISGVRSYTGYVKSKSGNDYTFAFIVNNFYGSAATVKEKMWKVLNILK